MTTARRTYVHTLTWLPVLAFLCVGLLNILAGGASTEWGFVPPAWLWGAL